MRVVRDHVIIITTIIITIITIITTIITQVSSKRVADPQCIGKPARSQWTVRGPTFQHGCGKKNNLMMEMMGVGQKCRILG